MSDKQVINGAKYKSSVKDPGVPGVLKLTLERFVYIPKVQSSGVKLDVEFKTIRAHKFTKEGSKQALLNLIQHQGENYIFEFDSFADREECREFVARAIACYTEGGGAVPEINAPPQVNKQQLSEAETERRIKLLQEDSELQTMHKELVFGGILTEAEFWSGRKKLLDLNDS